MGFELSSALAGVCGAHGALELPGDPDGGARRAPALLAARSERFHLKRAEDAAHLVGALSLPGPILWELSRFILIDLDCRFFLWKFAFRFLSHFCV